MADEADEGKKTEVLSRVERLRELIEEDADAPVIERAFDEVRRSLDDLTRPGRADGEASEAAAFGEAPPAL